MVHSVSLLAVVLMACSIQPGQAQTEETQKGNATPPAAYIISDGPAGPVDGQVRYLLGRWPLDSEISVVEALTDSKCDLQTRRCSVRVKPVDVIFGRQREASYTVSYGPAKHCKDDLDHCVYVYDPVIFEVKRGERLVAFLAAAMRPPQHPVEYIASRLDRADDAVVESARNAVAGVLMAGARCQLPSH